MNKAIKILGIAVLAVTALGAGVAFAQTPTPTSGFGWMMGGNAQSGTGYGMMGGRGGMMDGYGQNGDNWEQMNAMHQWMSASGGMHTFVWNALADTLDLTSDELTAEVNSGKTIAQIAEEKGVSRTDLAAALETAHKDALTQAVTNGYLTQDQADGILAQMAGRYEWMIDNMGAGGMMGGRGGMMGGQAGGCHGNWNSSPTDEQPKP